MRKLLVLDDNNYAHTTTLLEKNAVRAVILRDGLVAMQQGSSGEYKILGGAVDKGETLHEALIREVAEESGLIVLPQTITEIGEIEEIREDIRCKGQKYISHSFYHYCDAKEEASVPQMTQSELEQGYHLVWVAPEEICKTNRHFLHKPWIARDTRFIEMLIAGEV